MSEMITVTVRDLRVGDRMMGTGETVKANQVGYRTRKGYRDVLLASAEKSRWAQWNAGTRVAVTRS